jgi:hypothetical protein
VPYLVEAALQVDPAAQIVLCAGAPDTPEIAEEVFRRCDPAAVIERTKERIAGVSARASMFWSASVIASPMFCSWSASRRKSAPSACSAC